jgi:hypothetical protein
MPLAFCSFIFLPLFICFVDCVLFFFYRFWVWFLYLVLVWW